MDHSCTFNHPLAGSLESTENARRLGLRQGPRGAPEVTPVPRRTLRWPFHFPECFLGGVRIEKDVHPTALHGAGIGFARILSRSDIPRIAVGFNPRNRFQSKARRVATVDGPGGFNLRIPNAGIEIHGYTWDCRYATQTHLNLRSG